MTSSWPPKGHAFAYEVTEQFEGLPDLSYHMSLPRQMAGGLDISTVRVGRLGGDTAEDLAFREELFRVVGSITIAGGQVEAAMKRLLLTLTQRTDFSLVDFQWAELHKRLLAECTGADQRRDKLRAILEWSEKHDLREQRHTAVHGSWWVYADCGARVSRWPRKEGDRVIVMPNLQHWERVAQMCWELVRRLDELVGDDWARAMLSGGQPNGGTFG